jgi:hypothetical protein
MPAGDGTGPMGFGPMTGRGAGYCGGFPVPGYMNPMPGRGMGMRRGWGGGRGWGRGLGWGRGFGWRHGDYAMGLPAVETGYAIPPFYPAPSGEQEARALRTQAEHLEGALGEIRKRIADLEASRQKEE